jgi:hypothetical protein
MALSPSMRTWRQLTVAPRLSQGARPRASESPTSSADEERVPDSDRPGPRTTATSFSWLAAFSPKIAIAKGRVSRGGAQGTSTPAPGWVGRVGTGPPGAAGVGLAGSSAGLTVRRRLSPAPPHRFALLSESSALGIRATPAGFTVVVRMLSATAT